MTSNPNYTNGSSSGGSDNMGKEVIDSSLADAILDLSPTVTDNIRKPIYIERNGITVRLWLCGVCNSEFQYKYLCKRHMAKHTDEKTYECNSCGQKFKYISGLSKHRATHPTDEYACDICSAKFKLKCALQIHKKQLHKNTEYVCTICRRGFKLERHLKLHMKVHRNFKLHQCTSCNKKFKLKIYLKKHIKRMHPMDPTSATMDNVNMHPMDPKSATMDNVNMHPMDLTCATMDNVNMFYESQENLGCIDELQFTSTEVSQLLSSYMDLNSFDEQADVEQEVLPWFDWDENFNSYI